MNDAATLGIVQRFTDRNQVAQGVQQRERSIGDPRGQRATAQQLHDDDPARRLVPGIVEAENMRVHQLGESARLGAKAGRRSGILKRDQLDGDRSIGMMAVAG